LTALSIPDEFHILSPQDDVTEGAGAGAEQRTRPK